MSLKTMMMALGLIQFMDQPLSTLLLLCWFVIPVICSIVITSVGTEKSQIEMNTVVTVAKLPAIVIKDVTCTFVHYKELKKFINSLALRYASSIDAIVKNASSIEDAKQKLDEYLSIINTEAGNQMYTIVVVLVPSKEGVPAHFKISVHYKQRYTDAVGPSFSLDRTTHPPGWTLFRNLVILTFISLDVKGIKIMKTDTKVLLSEPNTNHDAHIYANSITRENVKPFFRVCNVKTLTYKYDGDCIFVYNLSVFGVQKIIIRNTSGRLCVIEDTIKDAIASWNRMNKLPDGTEIVNQEDILVSMQKSALQTEMLVYGISCEQMIPNTHPSTNVDQPTWVVHDSQWVPTLNTEIVISEENRDLIKEVARLLGFDKLLSMPIADFLKLVFLASMAYDANIPTKTKVSQKGINLPTWQALKSAFTIPDDFQIPSLEKWEVLKWLISIILDIHEGCFLGLGPKLKLRFWTVVYYQVKGSIAKHDVDPKKGNKKGIKKSFFYLRTLWQECKKILEDLDLVAKAQAWFDIYGYQGKLIWTFLNDSPFGECYYGLLKFHLTSMVSALLPTKSKKIIYFDWDDTIFCRSAKSTKHRLDLILDLLSAVSDNFSVCILSARDDPKSISLELKELGFVDDIPILAIGNLAKEVAFGGGKSVAAGFLKALICEESGGCLIDNSELVHAGFVAMSSEHRIFKIPKNGGTDQMFSEALRCAKKFFE